MKYLLLTPHGQGNPWPATAVFEDGSQFTIDRRDSADFELDQAILRARPWWEIIREPKHLANIIAHQHEEDAKRARKAAKELPAKVLKMAGQ